MTAAQSPLRLAVIATHPIQYAAPWFRRLAAHPSLHLRVFYLWDFGVRETHDPGFGAALKWDIPMLDGYESELVENESPDPGTHAFRGLRNPTLRARVREFMPDAVLLTTYNFEAIVRFLAQWRRSDAPLIFRGDSHRIVGRSGLKEAVRRRLIAAVMRRFEAVLYVGHANRLYFRYHGVPDARLFRAPHAVDNERFTADAKVAFEQAALWRDELGIPHSHRVVAFVGKFEEKKRPLDLLRAFERAAIPESSLLFVGSGPLEAEIRNAARSVPGVVFAPFQNQSAMPRAYAAADLFVLPSYGSGETWGLAVNEAMCLGRPVIVSSHVGCADDLVKGQGTGLVFPAGDVPALADALTSALSDEERLAGWGRQARRVVSEYSFDAMTEGLERALGSLRKVAR